MLTGIVCSRLRPVQLAQATLRHGHVMRGKPAGVARSLEQRLRGEYPRITGPRLRIRTKWVFHLYTFRRRQSRRQRARPEGRHRISATETVPFAAAEGTSGPREGAATQSGPGEAGASTNTCGFFFNYFLCCGNNPITLAPPFHPVEINLDDVKTDWLSTSGQFHIRDLAHHYGVYQHLFGNAYFVPRVPLDIRYTSHANADVQLPVYYGNTIKPSDAQCAPQVSFDSSVNIPGNEAGDSLWTLILTNPDGHLAESGKEYVHWMV